MGLTSRTFLTGPESKAKRVRAMHTKDSGYNAIGFDREIPKVDASGTMGAPVCYGEVGEACCPPPPQLVGALVSISKGQSKLTVAGDSWRQEADDPYLGDSIYRLIR
jgi:hypothetical protein